MKKIIIGSIILTLSLFVLAGYAQACTGNFGGAEKYAWHLSGAVMPVPPYGSLDIPGSDTASKLIVNCPIGKIGAIITGIMSGLHPKTTYTVYLSNPYTPYVFTGWNVAGNWKINFEYQGSYYEHDMSLSQSGSSLTGSGGYPVGGPYQYPWVITSGSITGVQVHLTMDYTAGVPTCTMTMDGTINIADGTLINGTWSDNCWGQDRSGTWTSTSGQAIKTYTGDTGWPGLFNPAILPFTFTTNAKGSGTWHLNLKNDDITGPKFSIWVNENGGTMLISDNVTMECKDKDYHFGLFDWHGWHR